MTKAPSKAETKSFDDLASKIDQYLGALPAGAKLYMQIGNDGLERFDQQEYLDRQYEVLTRELNDRLTSKPIGIDVNIVVHALQSLTALREIITILADPSVSPSAMATFCWFAHNRTLLVVDKAVSQAVLEHERRGKQQTKRAQESRPAPVNETIRHKALEYIANARPSSPPRKPTKVEVIEAISDSVKRESGRKPADSTFYRILSEPIFRRKLQQLARDR